MRFTILIASPIARDLLWDDVVQDTTQSFNQEIVIDQLRTAGNAVRSPVMNLPLDDELRMVSGLRCYPDGSSADMMGRLCACPCPRRLDHNVLQPSPECREGVVRLPM